MSGGSNKKPTVVDDIRFESVKAAAEYLAESRDISIDAAKARLRSGRINVKKPAKPGESLVSGKVYKAWSRIVHGALNPKSKDYIAGLDIHPPWRDFERFYNDVGEPPGKNMAFTRRDKARGFFPDNCVWLSISEASRLNAQSMKVSGKLTGRRGK